MDVRRERKRRIKNDSLVFGLSNLTRGCTLYQPMDNLERNKIYGKIKISARTNNLIYLVSIQVGVSSKHLGMWVWRPGEKAFMRYQHIDGI